MAFFRPRVRIKRKHLCKAGIGQGGKELSRVVVKNPDVGQAFAFDQAQQIGDAVDEGIATDEADVGVRLGLLGQMLAAAEPDFQPNLAGGFGKNRANVQKAAVVLSQTTPWKHWSGFWLTAASFGLPAIIWVTSPGCWSACAAMRS